MRRFWITTLGCKVNQYDGAAVARRLSARGLARAEAPTGVDLLVINTCCVTTTAMQKSRQAVRQAARACPEAGVLVVGCYGDYDADRLRNVLVDCGIEARRFRIAGHHSDVAAQIDCLLRDLSAAGADGGREVSDAGHGDLRRGRLAAISAGSPGVETLDGIETFENHQRAFVKVQDGCDAFCSYCVVPYTRSRVRWRPVQAVADECRRLVATGHREIVLCGVFLGAYGRDTAIRRRWTDDAAPLAELIRTVGGIDGLWRVRLSSLEPGDLSEALLDACRATGTLAPHFHLPLQSGSENILRRMNRQYTCAQFIDTVRGVREVFDDPAVTTDIIVGFPGESDRDFRATLATAEQAAFSRVHLFPFSAIEGTAAWHVREQAPRPAVVKQRLAQLRQLTDATAARYRRRFIGRRMDALVEDRRQQALPVAMTDRYLSVAITGDAAPQPGDVVQVHVDTATDDGLMGHL